MSARFVDGFFVAGAAASELRLAPAVVALRASARLVDAAPSPSDEAAYGPKPDVAHVLELAKGSSEAKLDSQPVSLSAVRVASRQLSWGPAGSGFQRGAAQVVVSLASPRRSSDLVVGEALADDEASARAEVEPLRAALEAYANLVPDAAASADSAAEPAGAPSSRPSPRFSVGFEGDAVVVRDHESRGPREAVGRYRALALFSLLLALAASFAFVAQLQSAAPLTSVIGFGAAIPVSLLGAVAMFAVAHYAGKYSAHSSPLAWFANDRVVVAPWVSREGAIGLAPEGRFGAAITPREITAVEVRPTGELFAVTLDGPHGPIEVLLAPEREIARHYQQIIERLLRAVSAPKRRAVS